MTSLMAFQGIALTADFTFTSGCLGTPTTLTSISSPPDSILALLWDTDMDGLFNDGSGETVTLTFTSIGNHSVGLQVVAKDGTIAAIYKDVPVSGVQASFSFTAGCIGQPIQFTDLSIVFADSVIIRTWNFGDGSPSTEEKDPVHTYHETGTFVVTQWLITGLGCQDSLKNEIVMQSAPESTLQFTADTATYDNDTILVEVVGTYDSAIWNNTINGSVFMITQPGTYSVLVYRYGCFTSSRFTIRNHSGASALATIMTLFTPNGDGYNDFWVIRFEESKGSCAVRVFDSWGNLVYENDDYRNTWDGTSDKIELPSGPYYYVILFADGQIFKGTVNILR